MPINGLLHVAIKTNDLEATIRFYRDVVGLTEVHRPDFGYPGAWLGDGGWRGIDPYLCRRPCAGR